MPPIVDPALTSGSPGAVPDVTAAAGARRPSAFPFLALVGGAMAMGISPVFVRTAELGPFTSAFWRVALALPALLLWAWLEERGRAAPTEAGAVRPSAWGAVILAGLMFAGDLTFWHLAIVNTTVANATFLATLAPVWVVLGSGLFLGERVARPVLYGLALGLAGAAVLIGGTLSFDPARLDGDLYGVLTSVFFGAYFLAVRRARRAYGAGRLLFLSSLVTALLLGVQALIVEDAIWPATLSGVAALFGLALVSHAGGQGLLAYALGHLPAAFSALVIFLEAVFAALFGWVLLGEGLGLLQALGALAIFAGIAVARNAGKEVGGGG